jgi:hypothetical protein
MWCPDVISASWPSLEELCSSKADTASYYRDYRLKALRFILNVMLNEGINLLLAREQERDISPGNYRRGE